MESVKSSSCFLLRLARSLVSDDLHSWVSPTQVPFEHQVPSWRFYVLENDPVPIFRTRSSSKVGSHTISSHIWQYNAPLLESTSASRQ